MAVNDRRRKEPIRNRVRWALVLAASLVLACSSDVTSPTSPLSFQLSFSTQPSSTYSGPTIIGTSTAIVVTARFLAPTPCNDLTATVNQHAAAINITVTASQKSAICEQPLAVFDYWLVLNPAPGTYHVTVHQVGEAGSANTTFTQDVTVSG